VTSGAEGARRDGGWRAVRAIWPAIAGAFAFRYAAYAAMTAMALWAEMRPAPTLPDALLAHLPYVPWIDRANYWLWLFLYLPLTAALLWSEPRRWVRYMVTGGMVSLARGVTIALTGLGVPDPAHAGPGIGARTFGTAFAELLSPAGVFDRGAIAAYLTKDLFFSGHVATTFLLWLYLRGRSPLAAIALAANLAVTASVLLSHIHYSIDVVGAWAITFAIFALREGWPEPKRSLPTP
jgi:membrane-associated phospholipid phosphatase